MANRIQTSNSKHVNQNVRICCFLFSKLKRMFRRFSSKFSKSFVKKPFCSGKRFLFIAAATGTIASATAAAAAAALILPVVYFPDDSVLKRTNTKILSHLYKNYFPVNLLTKQSEWISRKEIPQEFRSTVFQYYSALTGANLQEIEKPLQEYRTLDEFFTRKLKKGLRRIDEKDDSSVLVSPVDGRVVSYGKLNNSGGGGGDSYINEVKGYRYKLQDLIRTSTTTTSESSSSSSYYYIHLYLDPGDYHRFHSPTDLEQITNIEHIQGELYTVNPTMTSLLLPNIFTLNERVVITSTIAASANTTSTCKLYYVPVGATNVSSIELTLKNHYDDDNSTIIKKGEEIGMFHLGSTIVLIVEMMNTTDDSRFEFDEQHLKKGEKIQLGKSIGRIIVSNNIH
jgi:phosphatidylserine decarboxylase